MRDLSAPRSELGIAAENAERNQTATKDVPGIDARGKIENASTASPPTRSTVGFRCPGSRWRVVRNLYILSFPSAQAHVVGTARAGQALRGELFVRGWLHVHDPEQEKRGWAKLRSDSMGELLRREDDGIASIPFDERMLEDGLDAAGTHAWGEVFDVDVRDRCSALIAASTAASNTDVRLSFSAMRWLLVQPTCGLCNRLRAVSSALDLARRTRRALLVQWFPSRECQAAMHELWEPHAELRCWPLDAPPPVGARRLDVDSDDWRSLASRDFRPETAENCTTSELLFSARCLVVRTCEDFFPVNGMTGAGNGLRPRTREAVRARQQALRIFVPAQAVACALAPIQEWVATGRTIGVHVRRGDNSFSRKQSPLGGFTEMMDAELRRDPATRFYLASDCDETKAALVARYGDRLRVQKGRTLGRDSVAGMRGALVDLLALSNTSRVIGSWYSSFSVLASLFRAVPLHIVGDPQTLKQHVTENVE